MTINDQDWNFLNVPSEGVGALQNIGNKDIKLVFTGAKKNAYSDVNNCILENNLKTNFEILGFRDFGHEPPEPVFLRTGVNRNRCEPEPPFREPWPSCILQRCC